MSIRLITAAWDTPMPSAMKLTLVAMCDWANDDGLSLHPSIKVIAKRISTSERTVQRILRKLESAGFLSVIGNVNGGCPGTTRKYQIHVGKLGEHAETGDTRVTGDSFVTGDASVTRRVTNRAETGDTRVTQSVIDPLFNRQRISAPAKPDAPEPPPPGSLRAVRQADLPPGYRLEPPKPEEPPKTKTEPIPFEEFREQFNGQMEKLPKVRALTTKRRTQLRRLWHEVKDFRRPGFVRAYFETCSADPFLNGTGPYRNGHENWRPTFDYLTRPDTATRVIEEALS